MPKKKEAEEKKDSKEAADAREKEVKKEPIKLSETEYEKKVISYAKEGFTSEKIGEKLRKESIHPRTYNNKISVILKENKLYVQPDIKNIESKLNGLRAHSDKNKGDMKAKREVSRIHSQLRKIKEYHKVL
jgi:ribosomal protein S15P/S13E